MNSPVVMMQDAEGMQIAVMLPATLKYGRRVYQLSSTRKTRGLILTKLLIPVERLDKWESPGHTLRQS